MINNANLVTELERLLNENLERVCLPYVRGNSIRIKNHIIRKSKAGWLVYNIKDNVQIAQLFSKTAAIALAKSLAEGADKKELITYYDKKLQKHFLDAMFFQHHLTNTASDSRKVIFETRYIIAKEETELVKDKLDRFIFD